MARHIFVAFILAILLGCGGGGSNNTCVYTLQDDVTGEIETMAVFPPVVRARGEIPPATDPRLGFSIVLEHPADYAYLKTLIVPACREPEARQILIQRH
jgi:hypothetical protein